MAAHPEHGQPCGDGHGSGVPVQPVEYGRGRAWAYGQGDGLYYESAAVLISLISLGKYLEAVSRFRMSDAIGALMNLTPETALRLPAPDKADQPKRSRSRLCAWGTICR